ncbi:MAG: TonB family protein [Pseudomonadota bacterium]
MQRLIPNWVDEKRSRRQGASKEPPELPFGAMRRHRSEQRSIRGRSSSCQFGISPLLLFLITTLLVLDTSSWAQNIREELKEAPQPKLTKVPELLNFVPASYPPSAQKNGIQGQVEMIITIDSKGNVVGIDVISSPDQSLTEAAKEAVKKFQFLPAEVDGKPAAVNIRYAYNFVLEKTFEPRAPLWLFGKKLQGKNSLVGRIIEQGSRLPLVEIAVAVQEAGIEVKTDSKGNFAVPDLLPGTYEVKAISPDHEEETISVTIRTNEQTNIQFYLTPLRVNSYETVVRGKRRQTTVTRITLRQKELTTVPGTFGDPVRVVENLPGMARIPYIGGAMLIRGASPNDSGVYLDGIRIPILYHFLGGPSVLNPEFLDRIDYYAGNADSRYGRLIAGVVDVATRSTFTEQYHGSLDINLLNASLFLNVPITKKISVSGAVRRSYVDALLALVTQSAGEGTTTVVPVYYDYQLRVDANLSGDDSIALLAFGSDDKLKIVSDQPDQNFGIDFGSGIYFHRIHALWRKSFGQNVVSKLAPNFGFESVNFEAGESNVDIQTLVFGLREDLEIKLKPKALLRTGLDIELRNSKFGAKIPVPVDYRNPGAPLSFGSTFDVTSDTQQVDLDELTGGIGAYMDSVFSIGDKLEIIPGLRAELFFYAGNVHPSLNPRLTARYNLLPSTILKSAAGMYSQAPNPGQTN